MNLAPNKRFGDPDEFQEFMSAASGGVRVRPLNRTGFRAELSLAALPRIAMFSIETVGFAGMRPAAGDLWSMTIPLHGGFVAAVGARARRHTFDPNELLLLRPDRDFDYRTPETCRALVANLLSADIQQKAVALSGGRTAEPREVVSTTGGPGGALTRYAHYFWSELQRPRGLWDCPAALAEMEDCLVSLLALAASSPDPGPARTARLATVQRAEDFLIGHLTVPVNRSELADTAGASIRTVSRGFYERHGVGPMAWLRARRLEAAHRELVEAVPGKVTVTEVALRYGFANVGRFAVEYRRRFGESPSQTLRN